ncbi:MAG: hypothetical protein HC824_06275 [Synechococcales cyanobacterium RM1_1_8]|nr:hypothetical protein [Synechococcales cyanobacterium RM1_1_8]
MSNQTVLAQTVLAQTVLAQTVTFVRSGGPAPDRAATVAALLALEKASRQTRQTIAWDQLAGDWRLVFITGTQRSRKAAGVALGAGRFLPRWIEILIAYRAALGDGSDAVEPGAGDRLLGSVENRVRFAGVDLTVAGPLCLYGSRRILAFDFIRLRFLLGGISLFDGYVKGGRAREQAFGQKSLRDQAFFTYFYVEEELIAARGRGGGLAIWVREPRPETTKHHAS